MNNKVTESFLLIKKTFITNMFKKSKEILIIKELDKLNRFIKICQSFMLGLCMYADSNIVLPFKFVANCLVIRALDLNLY